jgi:L-lactate dehydrogenase complex protein LldF
MSGGGIRPLTNFTDEARQTLKDRQLRENLGFATRTIRQKRLRAIEEVENWEELRDLGAAIKDESLGNLAENLLLLEKNVVAKGGHVHWAQTAEEATQLVTQLIQAEGATECVKVKSITTDEIELNRKLEEAGIVAIETDLAELICQLAGDTPSHILVPAIHKNRQEIRELFEAKLGATFEGGDPAELADAARQYLRKKFLTASVAVSGANFAIAESGTVGIVESEGNGRMCLTLPRTLITVMGIEKVLPKWQDLATFLTLLPRSSTAERMNPYTSTWAGVTEGDGPENFHLILLDNGRTSVLGDPVGRETLRCIRCSACLNVCPVYERVGGHAYGSVYPGPIGSILTPQLLAMDDKFANKLPYASTLCGACYEVCPVKIDISKILVYLRGESQKSALEAMNFAMIGKVMMRPRLYSRLMQQLKLGSRLAELFGLLGGWVAHRDLPEIPDQTFRDWWRDRGE